jgi:hypothetical protein
MKYTVEQDELNNCWFIYDNDLEEALPKYFDSYDEANIYMQYRLNKYSRGVGRIKVPKDVDSLFDHHLLAFLTIPTLAALSTRSPIFHPLCMTTPTVLLSCSDSGIVNIASCRLGSNFSPLGSN